MIQLKQFKFEKLQVWDIAMDYAEKIHEISGTFPSKELYNLQSQINRASDSIALNISEGATGNSNLEFRKFLGYSIRSIAEVVCCLFKAKRRNYINEDTFNSLYSEAFILMNRTAALRNSIKTNDNRQSTQYNRISEHRTSGFRLRTSDPKKTRFPVSCGI